LKAQARRIAGISRVVADLDRAETFYRDALGFTALGRRPVEPSVCARLGLPPSEESALCLGAERIGLVQCARPGLAYPADLWFQHLAIVVSDMDAAYAHVQRWVPAAISVDGPTLLPPENGSVRAFKFRDSDGHPLELIWFPPDQGRAVWHRAPGLFLGIDHSALAVSSSARALRFYRSLGLRVSACSVNQGPAQSALDGLPDARVRVTGLRPESPDGPGLELLAYRPPGRAASLAPNATATDWVTVEVASLQGERLRAVLDPDGHRLLLEATGLPASGPET
jgi:catechol 2,3-dioxygenase-like lactoylglutathione lyase family enzyme